jgi:hypothetical protein
MQSSVRENEKPFRNPCTLVKGFAFAIKEPTMVVVITVARKSPMCRI